MCSNIVETGAIAGSGRGVDGWFKLNQAVVTFDHLTHVAAEHAVSIDFVNYDRGPGARVAVELTAESARELIRVIESALATGEAQHLPSGALAPAR
jgi:hypothetical protein